MLRLPGIVIVCLLITVGTFSGGRADTIKDNPEVVSLYARAKRFMRESNWLEASRLFEELAGRFPDSKNLDLFLFNNAKSQYYFGDYDRALAGFSAFVSRFPSSPYSAHARYFAGNVYYQRGQINRSFNAYLDAFAETSDAALSELLMESIVSLVRNAETVDLDGVDFERIEGQRRCTLVRSIAGVLGESHSSLSRMLSDCDIHVSSRRADGRNDVLDIAVVLPLSGELQTFGEEIYRGVQVAADILRAEFGAKLAVTAYDTKGDPVNAARLVKEIADGPAELVVGPLTSEETSVVSAVLDDGRMPLIAPAATETGLTLLSKSTFQLSPNIELEGIQMADYAALVLGADSAAIIASTQRDHLRMAEAFSDRFERHGGTVMSTQFYRRREKDFGGFIRDIKKTILGIFSDSTFFVDEFGDTLDPDGLPAHVDCLYLPGNSEQLRLLLPQIAFYNLDAHLLGSDGWGEDAIFSLGENVTKGAVFPSPFLMQGSSEERLKFSSIYDARYGKQAPRLASLGYDAVRAAFVSVSGSSITRESIVTGLERLQGYRGAAGSVTFGPNRENIDMPLYRIENAQAHFLGLGASITADSTMRADQ